MAVELNKYGFVEYNKGEVDINESLEQGIENVANSEESRHFYNDFSSFRYILRNIHSHSEFQYHKESQSLDLFTILNILKQENIFTSEWLNDVDIREVLSVKDSVSQDQDTISYVQKAFLKASINLPLEIQSILVGYSRFQFLRYFNFPPTKVIDINTDIIVEHPFYGNALILIESRGIRNGNYQPEREEFYEMLENLKESDRNFHSRNSQIILVVYSGYTTEQYETIKFKFSQFAKELGFEPSYLQRIQLIPGSINQPPSIDSGVKSFASRFNELKFTHRYSSSENIKNNHSIYPDCFVTNQLEFYITIEPNKTDFWRFGFVLSDNIDHSVDKTEENRHSNENTTDIHLCIGDLSNEAWINPHQMTLTDYKAIPMSGSSNSYNKYRGQPVNMRIVLKDKSVFVTVAINNSQVVKKTYVCDKKYVHFMAWCDYKEYDLRVTKEIRRLNRV
jgi:hypothetical protein